MKLGGWLGPTPSDSQSENICTHKRTLIDRKGTVWDYLDTAFGMLVGGYSCYMTI